MAEYPPQAIQQLFNAVKAGIPAALMGGIQGDAAHGYGYHRGRNYVSGSDYSAQLSADKQGDGEACSALDLSWSTAQPQYDVSRRLLNAKTDPRVTKVLRSFFGSTDGKVVCGWDFQGQYAVSSDSSHLWHVHLSILRKYSNDYPALAPLADVLIGKGSTSGGGGAGQEDEMKYASRVRSNGQSIGTDWKTLATDDDGNPGWDLTGPVKFQAQANVVISGLAAGEVLLLRFFTLDNKGNQNQRAYNWPQIEIVGTAGNSNGSIVQYGAIGAPASGWKRWLRLEAHTEKGSVTVAKLQSTTFSQ